MSFKGVYCTVQQDLMSRCDFQSNVRRAAAVCYLGKDSRGRGGGRRMITAGAAHGNRCLDQIADQVTTKHLERSDAIL